LYGTVWAILVSIGHVTLIKETSFGAETWLITQNLKPEKGCVIEKLSSLSGKENGNIVIHKMTVENCLLIVIMVHLAYGGHFLQKTLVTSPEYCLLNENARHHTSNWTAVYGCTSDRLLISPNHELSVLSLTESLRSTCLVSDCHRRWCDASYRLLVTDTRKQRLYPGI
jgi:hypothetical protein